MAARTPSGVVTGRDAELEYKRGFDAGVAHQKKASPPPKAKELQQLLRKIHLTLSDVGEGEPHAEVLKGVIDAACSSIEKGLDR